MIIKINCKKIIRNSRAKIGEKARIVRTIYTEEIFKSDLEYDIWFNDYKSKMLKNHEVIDFNYEKFI